MKKKGDFVIDETCGLKIDAKLGSAKSKSEFGNFKYDKVGELQNITPDPKPYLKTHIVIPSGKFDKQGMSLFYVIKPK